jgi:hypothetical protein
VLFLLAAVFFRTSHAPIWHLDTWSHWKYGQWICDHGRLPEREPFSPYSDRNSPLIDTWWLSQVVCYLVYARAGMEGIALFYGLAEVARTGLYLLACRRVTGSIWLALVAVLLMQAGRWMYFGVFRPQVLGEVCWAALLAVSSPWLTTSPPTTRGARFALVLGGALAVGLWANLHGAFLLAFVWLGVLLAGRCLDQAWARRNLSGALADLEARPLAVALGLSVVAACVNPYGPRLLVEAVRFGRLPVLQYVVEWKPLAPLATYNSTAVVVSFVGVLLTVRLSPRRFGAAEVILLAFFGPAAWFAARMLPWWMTVWPLVLLPHWQALLAQTCQPDAPAKETPRPSLARRAGVAMLAAGALGLLLASGTGRWLLRGQPRPAQEQVISATPVAAAERLKAWMASPGRAPGAVRVFASAEWCDYLLWELPPPAQVYFYSHWNCFAPRRLEDEARLLSLTRPPHDWRRILDRYRLNVLAVRADGQAGDALLEHLRAEATNPAAEWQLIYDAADGVVAVRRVDPFVNTLAGAQAAQGCVGLGLAPLAGQWAVLTHLPWIGKEP